MNLLKIILKSNFNIWIFTILSSSFFILAGIHFTIDLLKIKKLESRLKQTLFYGQTCLEKKQTKETFLKRYAHSDPYFLEKNIESLSFLEDEKKQLEIGLQHPAILQKKLLKHRLGFLQNGENQLCFVQDTVQMIPTLKETTEKLRHPIQLNETDLKHLLSWIEDVPIEPFSPLPNMPQLIIKSFKMQKKETPLHSEILELEMELLKREWIQPHE